MQVRTLEDMLADIAHLWHRRYFSQKWACWCHVPSAILREACQPDDELELIYRQLTALPSPVTSAGIYAMFEGTAWATWAEMAMLHLKPLCNVCEARVDCVVELWERDWEAIKNAVCLACLEGAIRLGCISISQA